MFRLALLLLCTLPVLTGRFDDRRTTDTSGQPVRLRLSGSLQGRLEPCGCASGQVGGLARRTQRNLQERSYDFLIEGGGMLVDGGPLDELKLFTTLNVLDDRRARYDVVGLGAAEFLLPFDLLDSYVQSFPELRFVASDVVGSGERWEAAKLRARALLERDGHRVVIAALAGALPAGEDESAHDYHLRRLSSAEAWQRALDGVDATRLRILLVHGESDTARAAARDLRPRPDLVVAIHDEFPEPPREPELVDGVPVVHPGIRGRFLVDVALRRGPDGPRLDAYRATPLLGKGKPDANADPATAELILAHRFEVAEDGTLEAMAERHPTANGASYVGSATCAGCHNEAYQTWESSKHAGAWQTLEKAAEDRYGWPVTKYPDCVACHTVGYGHESGFVNPERTEHLSGVGCESCHGAGSAHVAEPDTVKLGEVPEQSCRGCHDFEQSPNWDRAARWKLIEHK